MPKIWQQSGCSLKIKHDRGFILDEPHKLFAPKLNTLDTKSDRKVSTLKH